MRTHVSLFAGIDAVGIAAERLGYSTTHVVESDPYCRAVLARRAPHAEQLDDIHDVRAKDLPLGLDLLSGGFPCQNLSSAGKGAGLNGDRSILWFEMLRIIAEARPRLVLIENVAVLRSRGLDVVVTGLRDAGYGCWWDCVPALAVGAPHIRDRIWITAVPMEDMPPFDITPTGSINGKMPRAGGNVGGPGFALAPQATRKDCLAALGAVKRDGVTWLTAIDSPLYPTPSACSYGSNQGGAAGRVGPVRHSLPSMARSGEWPDEQRMWPTPRASPNELRTTREAPSHGSTHGRVLAGVVCDIERQDGRVVPPPSMSAGSLNPNWVEWLMGLPVGWTDVDCDEPWHADWLSEHGIPRVARDVPNRKQRLMAIGNSLVWPVAYTRIEQAHRLLGIR